MLELELGLAALFIFSLNSWDWNGVLCVCASVCIFVRTCKESRGKIAFMQRREEREVRVTQIANLVYRRYNNIRYPRMGTPAPLANNSTLHTHFSTVQQTFSYPTNSPTNNHDHIQISNPSIGTSQHTGYKHSHSLSLIFCNGRAIRSYTHVPVIEVYGSEDE